MNRDLTRREVLLGAGALLCAARIARMGYCPCPQAGRVAVAKCKTYGPELLPALNKMFDH